MYITLYSVFCFPRAISCALYYFTVTGNCRLMSVCTVHAGVIDPTSKPWCFS